MNADRVRVITLIDYLGKPAGTAIMAPLHMLPKYQKMGLIAGDPPEATKAPKVSEIKTQLKARGLSVAGKKPELIERLREATANEEE